MTTNLERIEQVESAPSPEALSVHEGILPFATELSVLHEAPSTACEAFYGSDGVKRIPTKWLQADTVPGALVFCRDEGAQHVRSYKIRGAMAAVGAAVARDPGLSKVVTFSAGNHAQGVAQAAAAHGVSKVVIETFKHISPAKEAGIAAHGATLNKHETLEQARDVARSQAKQPGVAIIEPYDALETMAGQSTMMAEAVADLLLAHAQGELDIHTDEIIFMVPGGGGGAAAGMASLLFALKQQGVVGPNVKLRVAQMEGCNAIAQQLSGDRLEQLDASCDGTAVYEPGQQCMAIIGDKAFVDAVTTVPKGYVGTAMQTLQEQLGHPVEPAGALSLAGAMYAEDQAKAHDQGARRPVYLTIMSGANVTPITETHFAQAAFAMQSQVYARRAVYGVSEVLEHRARTEVASVAGARLLVASGVTA